MSILGVKFRQVMKPIARKLQRMVVTSVVAGTRGDNPTEHTEPTTTDYPCRGVEEAYTKGMQTQAMIQSGDVRITVMASTLGGGDVEPQIGWRVTSNGVTYLIIWVGSDPDPVRTVYFLHGRAV